MRWLAPAARTAAAAMLHCSIMLSRLYLSLPRPSRAFRPPASPLRLDWLFSVTHSLIPNCLDYLNRAPANLFLGLFYGREEPLDVWTCPYWDPQTSSTCRSSIIITSFIELFIPFSLNCLNSEWCRVSCQELLIKWGHWGNVLAVQSWKSHSNRSLLTV